MARATVFQLSHKKIVSCVKVYLLKLCFRRRFLDCPSSGTENVSAATVGLRCIDICSASSSLAASQSLLMKAILPHSQTSLSHLGTQDGGKVPENTLGPVLISGYKGM